MRPNMFIGMALSMAAVMLIAIACGGDDATATPAPTSPPQIIEVTKVVEVTKEVPVVETVEVTKEVQVTKEVEVQVTREVEVTKEVEVTREVEVVETKVVIATPTPTPRPAPTATPTGEPVVDRLRVGMNWERDSNDPHVSRSGMTQVMPMNENLIRYLPDGTFGPMLANSWSLSADGKSWTFNLRDDVQWQRGWGQYTSADTIHTLQRSLREDVESVYKAYAQTVVSIDTPDDFTVTFNSNQTRLDGDFMHSTRRYSLQTSKAFFDAEGQEGLEAQGVGTGPYQQVSRQPLGNILYERVPYEHWRITPDFPELELVFVTEDATKLAALLVGELHITTVPSDLEITAEDQGMRIISGGDPANVIYAIMGGQFLDPPPEGNVRKLQFPDLPWTDTPHPVTEVPWVDKRVRQAMNMAIDRETINDTLLQGRGDLNPVPFFHPAIRGYNPDWETNFERDYGYNPDRARELLAEVEAEIGQDLDWSMVFSPITPKPIVPRLADIGEALVNYWRDIGADIRIEVLDYEQEIIGRIFDWNLGGIVWTNATEKFLEPSLVFLWYYSKNGICCHFYENADNNRLFEELGPVVDLNQRHEILQDIGDNIYSEYGMIPLFWLFTTFTVNPNVVDDYVTSGFLGVGDLEYVEAVTE